VIYIPCLGEADSAPGYTMLDQFSETIGKIYAAAADQSRWEDALHSIEDLTDSAGVVINIVAKTEPEKSSLLAGPRINNHFSSAEIDEYNRDLLPLCPRVAAGIANPDLPMICDYMILSETEMKRDPVYDWFGRHDLRYFIGSPLGETERYRLMWSLQRTRSHGHAQAKDIELFELLRPHIARALALADQLGTLRAYDRFSSDVLDALPQAVFALGSDGRLLFANAAGIALVKIGDGLRDVGGRLQTTFGVEQERLDGKIREAAQEMAGACDGWLRVSRSNGGLPYAVLVAPLNVSDEQLTAAGAKILVLVHDTAHSRCASVEMLTSIYGLTETEARLASALSGGHSVESAAALLEMRPSTARFHLKAVFRKMGVGRQQDLVRLLTSLSILNVPQFLGNRVSN